jgi:hypothetical protein
MPLWLWGALAMGATCGLLCGLLLQPEQARSRARIIVLTAAATPAVMIAIAVRPAGRARFLSDCVAPLSRPFIQRATNVTGTHILALIGAVSAR